jgi:hypothetical protein
MVQRDTTSQNLAETGDQREKRKIFPGLRKNSTWVLFTGIALALVVVFFIILLVTNVGTTGSSYACGQRVIRYINANFVAAGTNASLISVSEEKGVYVIKTEYQSQEIDTYATKDCTLLFTGGTDMTASLGAGTVDQVSTPVKSTRPDVELYVMSLCPYGTQAESAIEPVVLLLGTTADFRVKYIATVGNATTAGSVQSLHGPSEAAEDLRQACIQSDYPTMFWPYLMNFNTRCYPQWQNSTFLASCGNQTAQNLGIDTEKIMACAQGDEGLSLLRDDENQSRQNNVYGSPTLIINGVTYQGARTPDAYKQAICHSYDVMPPACNVTLPAPTSSGTSAACG